MRARVFFCLAAAVTLDCGVALAQPLQARNAAEAEIRRFLQHQYRDESSEATRQLQYTLAWADLNGDRRDEALVYVSGPYVCGSGGCDLLILSRGRRGWRLMSEASITNPPIRILSTRTRGWSDIGVQVQGGGIVRGYEARLRFNGSGYSSNPSTAAPSRRRAPGRVAISSEDLGRRVFP